MSDVENTDYILKTTGFANINGEKKPVAWEMFYPGVFNKDQSTPVRSDWREDLIFRVRDLDTRVDAGNDETPVTSYALYPAAPNPFNFSTRIEYDVPRAGLVSIQLYNVKGQLVATLVDAEHSAGRHHASINGDNWSSGLYLCRMRANGFSATHRLLLLK